MAKAIYYYDQSSPLPTRRLVNKRHLKLTKCHICLNILGALLIILLLFIACLTLTYLVISFREHRAEPIDLTKDNSTSDAFYDLKRNQIVVVTNLCDGEVDVKATVVLMKSLLIFSQPKTQLLLILLTDKANVTDGRVFDEEISRLPDAIKSKIQVQIRLFQFPNQMLVNLLPNESQICAAFSKIFLPELLPETDAAIYIEPKSFFLSPVEQLWNEFSLMSNSQMIAYPSQPPSSLSPSATPRDNKSIISNREGPLPTKHALHLNPIVTNNHGVFLLNLTRLRGNNALNDWLIDRAISTKSISIGEKPAVSDEKKNKNVFLTFPKSKINVEYHEPGHAGFQKLACQWFVVKVDIKRRKNQKEGIVQEEAETNNENGKEEEECIDNYNDGVDQTPICTNKTIGLLHYNVDSMDVTTGSMINQLYTLILEFNLMHDDVNNLKEIVTQLIKKMSC